MDFDINKPKDEHSIRKEKRNITMFLLFPILLYVVTYLLQDTLPIMIIMLMFFLSVAITYTTYDRITEFQPIDIEQKMFIDEITENYPLIERYVELVLKQKRDIYYAEYLKLKDYASMSWRLN